MQGFVVGVSGGIDSAVTSTLCAKTGFKLLCLEMPIKQQSSQDSRASGSYKLVKKISKMYRHQEYLLIKSFLFIKIIPKTENHDAQFHSLANTRAG
ncbi:MAG: hypothetical protein CM15mP122_2670 [Bacteroidota bacterium]|nr:MAG: hypothetical protein CM15mP122_2670 [Bacteroidota bacterium]